MIRFKTLLIFSTFIFLFFYNGFTQVKSIENQEKVANYYQEVTLSLGQRRSGAIIPTNPITAVSVAIPLEGTFNKAYIVADNTTYPLELDVHSLDNETRQYSQLIHFDSAVSEIRIFSGDINTDFQVLLIRGQSNILLPNKNEKRLFEDCAEPTSINQSVWRAGLNPPSYARSFTQVEHVIVHHSAGSNSATNYIQVVRDIYIFHTEGRGWSDIGYNYLVAQDGTIFKGRDPDGGAQDNVIGAHFCGSNSTTMGICLLGDYNLASPTSVTLESLKSLITWKLKKENLDPLAFSSHPLNNALGSIGGHRDGCSTECPGNNTYAMLGDIRLQVADKLLNCDGNVLVANFSASDSLITEGESISFSNASLGSPESYEWTFEGGSPAISSESNPTVVYTNPGEYDVSLKVRVGTREEIVFKESLIKVEEKKELTVYPNPVRGLSIKLANVVSADIREIYFVDTMGKRIKILNPESEGDVVAISISQLNQGIYLLYVVFEGSLMKERILVL